MEEAERLFIDGWERWGRGEIDGDTFRRIASAYAAVLAGHKRRAALKPA